MDSTIDNLASLAKEGDKQALEQLICLIQGHVYGLAIRMLAHPTDAEDASQEILIKVITHLGTFRGDSSFSTWVYRVAANYLLTTHKRRAERRNVTLELCENMVNAGLSATVDAETSPEPEQNIIVQELMIRCVQAVLISLDRAHRIAYILGEVIDVTGEEGAYILNITPSAFRKRLSRARQSIQQFMLKKCGLVRSKNPCRCEKQVHLAIATGMIKPDKMLFASHPGRHSHPEELAMGLQAMDELRRVRVLFRNHSDYAAPKTLLREIHRIVDSVNSGASLK